MDLEKYLIPEDVIVTEGFGAKMLQALSRKSNKEQTKIRTIEPKSPLSTELITETLSSVLRRYNIEVKGGTYDRKELLRRINASIIKDIGEILRKYNSNRKLKNDLANKYRSKTNSKHYDEDIENEIRTKNISIPTDNYNNTAGIYVICDLSLEASFVVFPVISKMVIDELNSKYQNEMSVRLISKFDEAGYGDDDEGLIECDFM